MPKFVLDQPEGLRCSLEVADDGDLNIIINNHVVMWFGRNSGRLMFSNWLDNESLPGIPLDSEGCIQLCDDDRQRIAEQWNAEHKPTRGAKK